MMKWESHRDSLESEFEQLYEADKSLKTQVMDYLAGGFCLLSILTCTVYAVLFCLVNIGLI
jgi:hypothetical protein